MDVATLLASPRGRFFCAQVGYRCSADDRAADDYLPQSLHDALGVLAAFDVGAVARLSELDVLNALSHAADFARYWQPPDEEDVLFSHPDVVAALRPIAAATLSSPHLSWWAEPVDLDSQRLVDIFQSHRGWPELPRVLGRPDLEDWRAKSIASEARFREYNESDPKRNISGAWWSTPAMSGTYSTSRARECVGALELILEEDSGEKREARVYPVRIKSTPTVYEINGPADWARLVDNYPIAVTASRRYVWYQTTGQYLDWFIPDWPAVARDYDAVHLTMAGYLTTPGIAIPLTRCSGATVLAGWDPDATWWLRSDILEVGETPSEWRRSPGEDWAPL